MSKARIQLDNDYSLLLKEIKWKVKTSQIKASIRVNSELLLMYWDLGKLIVNKQAETNWGDGFISQLSKDLSEEFPEMKGFSISNIKFIKQWYSYYSQTFEKSQQAVSQIKKMMGTIDKTKFSPQIPDYITITLEKSQQLVSQFQETDKDLENKELKADDENDEKSQQVVDQFENVLKSILSLVPWGHHIAIITKCENIHCALFYVLKTIENSWSRSVLVHQIESNLYERQGKSINNFELTLPQPDSDLAHEILKSPYFFEFLNISEKMKEKDLQNALLDNMTKFLMELGYGFAFLGKQKLLTVGDDDFYVDLVFYHTRLHCYFIVELKIDDFKPEYSGKLNFYLNTFNDQIKTVEDKSTIGLLLCKKANKMTAEYSLKNIDNPIGISEYYIPDDLPDGFRHLLPSAEAIEIRLNA